MSLSVQLQTVVFMGLCGVLMGMGFDTYHLVTRRGRMPAWLLFGLDVLFWLSSVALAFFILLWVNGGIVRFPVFLSLAAGGWVYFALASRLYLRMLLTVLRWMKWLWFTLLRLLHLLLVRPVVLMFQGVWLIVTLLATLLLTVLRTVGRILFVLVRPIVTAGQKMGKRLNQSAGGIWQGLKKWFQQKRNPVDKE